MTNAVITAASPRARVARRERGPQAVPLSTPASSPPPRLAAPPVAGITCPVLTRAVRTAEQMLVSQADPPEAMRRAEVLVGVALAIAHGEPDYAVAYCADWPPPLVQRVVELLRTELLQAWLQDPDARSAYRVLRHVVGLEAVRQAVERNPLQAFTAQLKGPDGADALAEVLHDLRSPLSSIHFLAEGLEKGYSGVVNDLQRRQVRLIEIAALQLSMVADDAIDAAYGQRGHDDGPAPLTVTLLLNTVADVVRPVAEEKKLELRFVRPERDYRLGYESALQRVLLNLVTNALKFTHEGYVEVAAVDRGETRIEFSVRDTGPGIPRHAEEQLYRAFQHKPSGPTRRFSRTGLGLALCLRLVERLGGTLQHESPPDGGTRFWFEIDLPPLTRP